MDGGVKATAFVSHYDCSRHDTGWSHPEHQGRLPGLMRQVYRDMLTLHEPLLEVEGRHATREELLLAHSAEYLDQVEGWAEEAARRGRPLVIEEDLVVSGASYDAARAAVGCALVAVDEVLEGRVRNAFCAVRPPGPDAERDRPGRFGPLNPVATVVQQLLRARDFERVLVVGWGAGRVVTGSAPPGGRIQSLAVGWVAGEGNSPKGRLEGDLASRAGDALGEGNRPRDRGMGGAAAGATRSDREDGSARIDAVDSVAPPGSMGSEGRQPAAPGMATTTTRHSSSPSSGGGEPAASGAHQSIRRLSAGATREDFLAALVEGLDAASADFPPEIIVLSAGFEDLLDDPIGGGHLEPEAFYEATRLLRERADAWCGGRLISILAGGYNPAGLGITVVQHLRALAGLPSA